MAAALVLCGQAHAQSSGRRASGLPRQPLHRLAFQRRPECAVRPGANRTRRRPAALERRGRRLRPSADDRSGDPGSGGEFRQLRRLDVARRRAPQYLARKLRALYRRPHARSADHGSDGFAAGIHQIDLGLSRHSRQRQPPRQGPRDPGQIQAAVRRDGKSLWRRSLCDRGDLGHRVELLDADGRSQRRAIHRDAGLRRPPPEIFQGRIPLGAGNPASRRSASRADARLMGRRVRSHAVHADRVQALRGGCRRRRPPRRGRRRRRPDRLDRQQPEKGRLADRPELGLRGRGAAGLQLHAGGPRQGDDDSRSGSISASSARPTSRSRNRPRRPICWRPPAPRVPAS